MSEYKFAKILPPSYSTSIRYNDSAFSEVKVESVYHPDTDLLKVSRFPGIIFGVKSEMDHESRALSPKGRAEIFLPSLTFITQELQFKVFSPKIQKGYASGWGGQFLCTILYE